MRRFRPEKEFRKLDLDSTDVLMDGLLKYYVLRPDESEKLCLADYAAKYEYFKTMRKETLAEIDQVNIQDEDQTGKTIPLKNGEGFLRQRKTEKVIRYRRYNKKKSH